MAATVISREVRGEVHLITASGTTPEGSVEAPPGSVLLSESGIFYTKVTGTGNTGWSTAFPSGGTLPIANGGTGQTTAAAARLALLPAVAGNALEFLRVNAGETDYETVALGTAAFADTGTGGANVPTIADADARYVLASTVLVGVLESNQSTTSTSLVDCTGLSVTIPVGGTYQIEAFILWQSAATTTGIWPSFNGPASPTAFAAGFNIPTSATANAGRNITAYNGGSATTDSPAANTTYFMLGNGSLVNGANGGTFILRFASEVGGSAVTIMAGSSIRLTKVA